MGKCADPIITQLSVDEEKITYPELKGKLDQYFGVSHTKLGARAKFNKRVQNVGEPVDSFISELYTLANRCEYGELRDELIRDRIIVGIQDEALSDRLQGLEDLTLDNAIKQVRLGEARQQEKSIVRGSGSVDFIKGRNQQRTQREKSNTINLKKQGPKVTQDSRCGYCSREAHQRRDCPAKKDKCRKCQKMGHWAIACRQKSVSEVVEEHSEDEVDYVQSPFLGEIKQHEKETPNTKHWSVEVSVMCHMTDFKLDPGSFATIISDKTKWLEKEEIKPHYKDFRGPGGVPLIVTGVIHNAPLAVGNRFTYEDIYVMPNQQFNLLSKRACQLCICDTMRHRLSAGIPHSLSGSWLPSNKTSYHFST
jgi:hypothetical protein